MNKKRILYLIWKTGKILFIGDKEVKYVDKVSSGKPIMMMVRITGERNVTVCPPMLIFKNRSRLLNPWGSGH